MIKINKKSEKFEIKERKSVKRGVEKATKERERERFSWQVILKLKRKR